MTMACQDARRVGDRLTIRDVEVRQCQHWACSAYGAVFENVVVTDLRGGGRAPSFMWGCLFSRVTLRGWISGLLVRWQIDPEDDSLSREFLAANLSRYQTMDWALDITQAQFSFVESLPGVPAALVKRDPESHFVMTAAAARRLREESKEISVWTVIADNLLSSPIQDTVIAVGGLGKKLRTDLAAARALRDRGLLQ